MIRLVVLTCALAVSGLLISGCEKPPPPVAKKRQPVQPRTNRVAKATAPKTKPKPVPEIRMGTIGYLDAKNGFRDATFGQQDASFANLTEVSRDDARQLKICTREDENLSFHDVPLERVEYRFFRGELYAIEMDWKIAHPDSILNRPPTTGLSTHLTSEYGPPRRRRVNKEGCEYGWRGQRVQISYSEALLPGVTDLTRGGWGLPPTTVGRMVIRNLTLARAAEGRPIVKSGKSGESL